VFMFLFFRRCVTATGFHVSTAGREFPSQSRFIAAPKRRNPGAAVERASNPVGWLVRLPFADPSMRRTGTVISAGYWFRFSISPIAMAVPEDEFP
jgi:hypothetical protein